MKNAVNMKFEELSPQQQLCRIMGRIYEAGLTTVSGGNLSLKDKDGNIWVTPSGGDKGRYTPQDILKIDSTGEIHGKNKPSIETGIHKLILELRPEFNAVVHAHPAAMVAASLLREIPETMLTPKTANGIKAVGMAAYACPGSKELVQAVGRVFEKRPANMAILENHGAFAAAGGGIKEAFKLFQNLDFSIRMQAGAGSIKGAELKPITQKQLELYNRAERPELEEFQRGQESEEERSKERELRQTIVDFVKRAYNRGLMTADMGVISARIDKSSFLITESGTDRGELGEADLVKIKGGRVEAGKTPSKSVRLHEKIYKHNPEINCIVMAAPANAMVFAVTDQEYRLDTIPECYMILKNLLRFPFGASITQQQELAEALGEETPTAIIENDCFISTGADIFKAFDRLEVAEFCGEAVITAHRLGGRVHGITPNEVKELKDTFGIK